MDVIKNIFLENSDILKFIGPSWILCMAAAAVVFLFSFVYKSSPKPLMSQKGKTEFAQFYMEQLNDDNGMQEEIERGSSVIIRRTASKKILPSVMNDHLKRTNGNNKSNNKSMNKPIKKAIDFYFEFNEEYNLLDE